MSSLSNSSRHRDASGSLGKFLGKNYFMEADYLMKNVSPGTPSKRAKEELICLVNESSQRPTSGTRPRSNQMLSVRNKQKSENVVGGTIESDTSGYVKRRGKSSGGHHRTHGYLST